ncbi:MAG: Hsp20/alpha crystallin family protein [Tepidisphaeraceae bacterium]
MTVKFASEPLFGNFARQMGKLDPYNKGFFGFVPSDVWTPNVNLYESDACYLVCVDLAGVEKDKIDVVIHQNRLRLSGRRPAPVKGVSDECAQRVRIHLMEIDHGAFTREVELPEDIDENSITATYDNGLLWIEIPKLKAPREVDSRDGKPR